MLLASGEQLLGLGQAALANAELRETRRGGRLGVREVAGVQSERALERPLGVVPAAGRQEHVGVDGAAGAEQWRHVVARRILLDHRTPLGRPLPFAGARARRDEMAVGLTHDVDVACMAGRGGRHRLLEQGHPI